MINKIFLKTFKRKSIPKQITHSELKTLNTQENLVNSRKAFAQAINIVIIRLLIEKNMSLFYYVVSYAENQHNSIAEEVN